MLLTATLAILILGALGAEEAGRTGAGSPEEFVERIRAAVEHEDREALSRLSYWEGVDRDQRQRLELRLEPIYKHPVHDVQLRPRPAGYKQEYVTQGIRYRINLPVEGLVRVEFAGKLDTEQSRLFPFGTHEGRYYIAQIERVGPVEEQEEEKQLMIGVMTPSGPDPADYIVSCSYNADGEERREKFEGHRSTQKVVWGTSINWCRLWNRSDEGWVRLVLKEDLETYFESSQAAPGRTVRYP
jgi:hypothetical protein